MLYESGMPPSFWGEALSSFIHVHNRVTTTVLPGSTLHEAFLGTKSDLSMLCVWGCPCLPCPPLLALIHFLSPPLLLCHFQSPLMTFWMITLIPHSCLFMGETSLCILNSLLFHLRLLHHPHSSTLHQHRPLLPSLHLPVLLPSMNHLLLAHSVSDSLGKSGYQNSGRSLRGIGSSESPLQFFHPLKKTTTLMKNLSLVQPAQMAGKTCQPQAWDSLVNSG
jgi:hypothetical protein